MDPPSPRLAPFVKQVECRTVGHVTRSVAGAGVLGLALLAYALALDLTRRGQTPASSGAAPSRWAGYLRDAVNLGATCALVGAYLLVGFAGPPALLAGLLTTLAAYLCDWTIAVPLHARRPPWLVVPPLAAWALFVAIAPDRALALFARLLALT